MYVGFVGGPNPELGCRADGPMGRWRGLSDRTIPPGMKKTAMMIAVDGIYRTDGANRDDRADGKDVGIGRWRLG